MKMRIGYKAHIAVFGLWLILVMAMMLVVHYLLLPEQMKALEHRGWSSARYLQKVCSMMTLEEQQKMLEELILRQPDYAYAVIIDKQGKAIAHNDPSRVGVVFDDPGTIEVLKVRQEMQQIYTRDSGQPYSPHHGEEVIDIFTPHYDEEGQYIGCINLGVSMDPIYQAKARYYQQVGLAAAILLALLLFIDWRFQKEVVYQLENISSLIRRIREGRDIRDTSDMLISAPAEISSLVEELDTMAQESSHLLSALTGSEASLRKQVNYLNTLLENMNEIFFTYDREGKINYANHKFFEMTGLDWRDVLGKHIFEFLPEMEKEKARVELANRLNRGISGSYELELIFPDDSKRYLLLNSAPIMEERQITGGMILADDVTLRHNTEENLQMIRLQLESRVKERTIELEKINSVLKTQIMERKQVEKALRRSEEKFAAAFRLSPEAITISSLVDGRILEINDSWLRLMGYEREEVLGKNSWELGLWVDEELRNKVMGMAQEQKTVHNMEVQFKVKDGHIIDTLCSFSMIIIDDEPCILFLTSDISERKRLEEEMLKASKLESLGVLAGGIAHDFNNLLTVIVGNIALAKLLLPENAEAYELLNEAEKASFQSRGLTQQLLTFSKGGAPVRQTAIINELIKDSAGFALRGSKVTGEFDLQEDLYPVDVDEVQLSQVINNMMINAVQAMPEGGKVVLRAYNVTFQSNERPPLAPGSYVCIEVEDQGVGIEHEWQNLIFDPFFTTKMTGSGLGLATSYSIIHKHDGFIDFKSRPGQGTTFYIYLPASSKPISLHKKEELQDFKGGGRILLMDDETGVRNVARQLLKSLGYEVETVADGQEAVDAYRQAMENGSPFDAVITDLTVPGGKGGRWTVRELLKLDPEARVIVSSGYSNDPVMAEYQKWGFKGVIGKPFTLYSIQSVLKSVI